MPMPYENNVVSDILINARTNGKVGRSSREGGRAAKAARGRREGLALREGL